MKIGILGCDDHILAIAVAAVEGGHSLSPAYDVPDDLPAILSGIDRQPREQWQGLLEDEVCDAVLVGVDGWSEHRAEQVRTLVQAGRTILIGHPASLSMLWAYELDMILADSSATVIPALATRHHPFIYSLKNLVEQSIAGNGPLGPIESLQFERRQPDRDQDSVLTSFARDADVIRVLIGDPSRLMALGGGDAGWANLAVGLSGPDQVSVRWQVAKGHTRELTIQLICERGRLCIDIPERDCGVWAVTQQTDAGISDLLPEFPSETAPFQPAEVLLELLLLAVKGDADNHSNSSIPPAIWPDAARTIELAETIPRSVKRGRGIDLHQEEFSELGTFRGTMASLGCGIIMAGLFILFLATLVGGVARAAGWSFGERLAAIWPYAILTTLILFLILQLLPFLLPKDSGNSDESKPSRSENS
ncbi:MAG TPA: hypothetical protein DDZ24_01310 [Planctomycetaceae bacterium]|nr:hypothetical protein [Planctomycetaceae bacterium]|tara:strand:- start:93 stop:1352 length:1260 start_codon:yes stop_codon:yes gene_type:complete